MNDMDLPDRFRKLEAVYAWHDDIAASMGPWACEAGCPDCCTDLVTMTTLEAAYLWRKCADSIRERLGAWPDEGLPPDAGMTANERAELCMSGTDFEEDAPPSVSSACPLLEDGRCLCYEGRPLMCRMMLSSESCGDAGYAEIPTRLLSLTTVCQQMVEHIDRRGQSGYLIHMLPRFENFASAEAYDKNIGRVGDERLRPNRPNPGFLIPPEDRPQIRLWLRELDRRSSRRWRPAADGGAT